MLRVIEYFTESLKVAQSHSKWRKLVYFPISTGIVPDEDAVSWLTNYGK